MIFNFKTFLIGFFSVCMTTSAFAGNYVAFDVGQTTGKDACSGNPSTIFGCEDTANLFRFAVGQQVTPVWGAEFSYGNYGKANAGSGTVLGYQVSGDWNASGIQISGVGTFPVSNGLSLIGKLGIARTDIEFSGTVSGTGFSFSSTSSNLAFGFGMQYSLSSTTAIRAQYEDLGTVGDSNTTGTSKVTLLSAGLVFNF